MSEKKYEVAAVSPRIEQFLRTVLHASGFKIDFEIGACENPHPDFENPDVVVKFAGPDADYLLTNRGELLLALEHLTTEMLRVPAEHHSRIWFDAHDYRALRLEELRLSAAAAADKVRRTGEPFKFSPMNSRERRILHLALRNEAAVRSESTGIGSSRQVVIYPEQQPNQQTVRR